MDLISEIRDVIIRKGISILDPWIGGGSFSLVNTQNLLNQVLRDYSNVKLKET